MKIQEGQQFDFKFGFDPNTNEAKINIYDTVSKTYIISFYFNAEEELRIKEWAAQLKGKTT